MNATTDHEKRITDTLRERAGRTGRSPGVIVIDAIWRFFCSTRAAVYEIVFLAILVLIGTLKGSVIPAQLPRLIPALDPVVRRWYQFDVFHSLIFSLVLALLAVAIAVCTINRAPGIWHAIARPTVLTTRGFFQAAEPAVALRVPKSPAAVAGELAQLLKRRRYRVLTEQRGDTTHIYADKNRFARLGTFPFHLALILVLAGGIAGSEYGFRETAFTIPEGSTRDVGHNTGLSIKLERFVDTYDQIGAPTSYRSDVILYDGEHEVRRASIMVNHPLTYGNITFYQASFGPAAVIRVTDAQGNVVFEDGVEFTYVSRLNRDAPAARVELPAQGIALELVFPNVRLDNRPEVEGVKLLPGEMWVRAHDWRTNQPLGVGVVLSQGETVQLGGYEVRFVRERRFTVLQVAYNPGIPMLFAASLLLVFGLVVTFAFPHRRVRALVAASEGGTEMLLAPLARRDWGGKRDFADTLVVIEQRFGAAASHGRTAHVVG